MGRNTGKAPLDRSPVTYIAGGGTTTYSNLDVADVGRSLTASVTAISVNGTGWLNGAFTLNRISGITIGGSGGGFRAKLWIDGNLCLSDSANVSYGWNPLYGWCGTDGSNFVWPGRIPFQNNLMVTLESIGSEGGSFSLALALSYVLVS